MAKLVYESCESQVANLLASLDNLPENDLNGKINVLCEIIAVQDKEVANLKRDVEELKPKRAFLVARSR
jgi:hypothetical protein